MTRRIRNLALFAVVASIAAIALVVVLRPVVQRAMGVSVDLGSGGLAELVVPDGYDVSVFAEGFASPRFMDVSSRHGKRRRRLASCARPFLRPRAQRLLFPP